MNLRENLSRFLGRSLSAPWKFIGESTTFEKNSINGGFDGMIGGGRFGDGMGDNGSWNGSGRILGSLLSQRGL